jgi:Na+/melibiose symporter-like transporter
MYVAQYFLFRNTINVTLLYVLGIVLQYFAGANMSIIYGMVPDTVEVTEYQTKGIRMDGFLNTVSSFWNKVGITIGTSGAPLILALTGYVANAPTPLSRACSS